jgi:hypothetical protein
MNLAPGFAQEGIIHGDHQGRVGVQAFFDLLSNRVEEGLRIKPIFGVEAVVGRPVALMTILSPEQAADGVTAKTDEMREDVAPAPLEESIRTKGSPALIE